VKSAKQTALTKASQADLEKQVLQKVAQQIGLKDTKLAVCFIEQLHRLRTTWSVGNDPDALSTALTTLLEMKPETSEQAMLSVQMAAVHDAAIASLQRAAFHQESSENPDMRMTRAVRFMRLFIEQVDAIARLKGKNRPSHNQNRWRWVHLKTEKRPHEPRGAWLRNGNRVGDFSKAPRCGAKTRRGTKCQCPGNEEWPPSLARRLIHRAKDRGGN